MCYKMGGDMKKVTFLCCLFCGLITQAIGVTYNCKEQNIGSLASRLSNEYLFVGESNWKDKIALVCGHKGTDGCEHGTIVVVSGEHYYKNMPREASVGMYECNTSGGSSWDAVSLPAGLKECSSTKGMTQVKGNFGNGAYYVYASMSTVKYVSSSDTSYRYAVIENPCYVWDGDDDSSLASSEEKKTDTKKIL